MTKLKNYEMIIENLIKSYYKKKRRDSKIKNVIFLSNDDDSYMFMRKKSLS